MKAFTCVFNNTKRVAGDKFWLKDQRKTAVINGRTVIDFSAENQLSDEEAASKNEKVQERLGLGICINVLPTQAGLRYIVLWEGSRSPSAHMAHELDWQDVIFDGGVDGDTEIPGQGDDDDEEAQPEVTETKGGKVLNLGTKGAEATLSNADGDFDEEVVLNADDAGSQFEDVPPAGAKAPAESQNPHRNAGGTVIRPAGTVAPENQTQGS